MTTAQSEPSTTTPEQEPGGKMSFFEHLVDLRKRLINSAVAICIGAMVGVSVSKRLLGFISRPMVEALRKQHLEDKLIYSSRLDSSISSSRWNLYWCCARRAIRSLSGMAVYRAWTLQTRTQAVTTFIFSSVFLFLRHFLRYFIMLPYMLNFLIGFQGDGPFGR